MKQADKRQRCREINNTQNNEPNKQEQQESLNIYFVITLN